MDRSTATPVVSVCVMAYNHERYIRQALDSVLMQKTSFPFEVIVGEDRSTDGTRAIVQEFEQRFPGIVVPIYHETNIGPFHNLFDFCFPRSRGKYQALLEGDDYWTDPEKLQRQWAYMEAHPDASVCVHNVEVIKGTVSEGKRFKVTEERTYQLTDLLQRRIIGHTSSFFWRSGVIIPPWVYTVYAGDGALLVVLALRGSIHYLPEAMSAHRIHERSMERDYDADPLGKAMRDIRQYRTYLRNDVVTGGAARIVYRKMLWNYTYRILKGITTGRLRGLPSDVVAVVRWSAVYAVAVLKGWLTGGRPASRQ